MFDTTSVAKLEKVLGFGLKRVASTSEILDSEKDGSFLTDGDGQLIGLNLWAREVKDISFLKQFPGIKYLHLGLNSECDFTVLKDLTAMEGLRLNYNEITDASFLSGLTHLNSLNLAGNNISDIDFLKNLHQLDELDLTSNRVTRADVLADKIKLTILHLNDNRLSDHSFLTSLSNLVVLGLRGTHFKDYSFLAQLKMLVVIYLAKTEVPDIGFLYDLPNLLTVDLSGVNNVPVDQLAGLNYLKYLYLNNINVPDYEFLAPMKDLLLLELNNNQLSNADFLTGNGSLEKLSINNNELSDIEFLAKLEKLRAADLSSNQITDIKPLLKFVRNGINITINENWDFKSIYIKGNPLESTILKILEQGGDAILRHFERLDQEGTDYIFEAKLTLVGEGGTGKTSLLTRLLDEKASLPREDARTRGIQISDWHFDKEKDKRKVAHIWDFGGQDVYYPVHRFFLTENSVFVLLASTRNASHNFEYWIPTIFQFGGRSPIILGQTCHDNLKVTWGDIGNYLSNTNFNIIKTGRLPYYELNLPNHNEGLQEIRNTIADQIIHLPHFGRGVPRSWIPVRIAIAEEAKKNACISFDTFKEICRRINKEKFSSDQEVEDIGNFLHFLGIIVWYSGNEELKEWVVLQPDWIMNAVYKIIDDAGIQNRHGLILPSDFQRLWSDEVYRGRQNILKKMLQVFKIVFPQKNKNNTYILPARLLSIPKESIWQKEGAYLRLQYHYEFMPKGLVNQLSAELSRLITSDADVWNNAVTFTYDNGTARVQVIEDFYHRKIYVTASGADARGLIMLIMNEMNNITDGYKGVEADLLVPCNCADCATSDNPTLFKHKDLIRWSAKRNDAFCNESGTTISINDLLFNIGLINPQKEMIRKEGLPGKPLKAFISYSKFDGVRSKGDNYLEDFKRHLVPLAKYNNLIQTWDDTLLVPGDDWDENIRKQLEQSDVIFLLISVNFLNTPYIRDTELKIAIERHNKKECLVIPVVISNCGWTDIEWLGKLSAIPPKGMNIASWSANPEWKTMDDAWTYVYKQVKDTITVFKSGLV